ncbi:MAG: hypothetical protein Q9208_002933 [Pyrenodesmia sp. 3 TL-2023]
MLDYRFSTTSPVPMPEPSMSGHLLNLESPDPQDAFPYSRDFFNDNDSPFLQADIAAMNLAEAEGNLGQELDFSHNAIKVENDDIAEIIKLEHDDQPKPLQRPTSIRDNKHYHMNTRNRVPEGPAKPYGDLPDDEYYAPGLTMRMYKALCSHYCGKITPAKNPKRTFRGNDKRRRRIADTDPNYMGCVLCGAGFDAPRNVESHWHSCVRRLGNPNGYHVSAQLTFCS